MFAGAEPCAATMSECTRERQAHQRRGGQMTNRAAAGVVRAVHGHRRLPPPPPPLLERELLLRLLCPRVLAARSDFPLE